MAVLGALEILVDAPDDVAAALRDFEDLHSRDGTPTTTRSVLSSRPPSATHPLEVLKALSEARSVFRLAAESADAVDFEAEPSSSFALRGNELGLLCEASSLSRMKACVWDSWWMASAERRRCRSCSAHGRHRP